MCAIISNLSPQVAFADDAARGIFGQQVRKWACPGMGQALPKPALAIHYHVVACLTPAPPTRLLNYLPLQCDTVKSTPQVLKDLATAEPKQVADMTDDERRVSGRA